VAAIDPIVVQVLLETQELKKQLDAVTRQFEDMGKKVEGQTQSIDKIGGGFKKLAGIIAGAFSVATVVNFFKQSVQAASNFQAESEGVRQTFGANAGAIQEFAKTAYKSAGLSEAAALGAAKGFGGFARVAGLAGEEASTFALSMTKAAGDLGSFNNVPTAQVLAAIKSGLAGQSEPLRRYNILLGDAALKSKAMSMGIMDANQKALTPQQKILATQQLILDQLGPAQNDFTNYAGDYANSFQTIGAAMENLKAQAGAALLPVLAKVMNALQPLIDKLGPLIEKTFEAIAPAINALVPAIESLLPILEPVFGMLKTASGFIAEMFEKLLPPLMRILAKVMPYLDRLFSVFIKIAEKALPPMVKLLDKLLLPALDILVDMLTNYGLPILEKLGDVFIVLADIVANVLVGAFEILKGILGPIWAILKPLVDALLGLAGIDTTIRIDSPTSSSGFDTTTTAGILAASKTTEAVTGTTTATKKQTPAQAAAAAYKKQVADLKAFVKEANTAVLEEQGKYAASVLKARDAYSASVKAATDTRNKDLAELEKSHADRILSINKDFAARLQGIVQQSMNQLRSAFAQVSKIDVGGLFAKNLSDNSIGQTVFTQMKDGISSAVSWWGSAAAGNGVAGIITTLQDKLAASKKLIENSAKLSGAGFSQTFIEQIVAQGTEMGNQIAGQVLAATPETQAQLQGLFTESEQTANYGMDSLAKAIYDKAGLATDELKNLYAATQNELVIALADEQALYVQAQADINATFAAALSDANKALQTSINDAGVILNNAIGKVNADLDVKIKAMKGKLGTMASAVKSLQSMISSSKVAATAAPTMSFSDAQKAAAGISNVTNLNTVINGYDLTSPGQTGMDVSNIVKYNLPYAGTMKPTMAVV
jgi:hypothetical protein